MIKYRIKNNHLLVDKYRIHAKNPNGEEVVFAVSTDEEKEEVITGIDSTNNPYLRHWEIFDVDVDEQLSVVYYEEPNISGDEDFQRSKYNESAKLLYPELVHGEWAQHTFVISGANYGIEPIYIKYGNGMANEGRFWVYIRRVKIYATLNPSLYQEWGGKKIPAKNRLILAADEPVENFQGQDVYKLWNWMARLFEPSGIIPTGTSELTVEVEYYSDELKPMAVDTTYFLDITVEEDTQIQEEYGWANGEEVTSSEEAEKLLIENKGRWKNRKERLDYLKGQTIREKRNRLLDDVDLAYCNALNLEQMPNAKKEEWRVYKQKLRDITKQEGFPNDVKFPEMPE